VDPAFELIRADDHEAPGLHISHRAGVMRRVKNAREHFVGNSVAVKMPDISAAVNGLVDFHRLRSDPLAQGVTPGLSGYSRDGKSLPPSRSSGGTSVSACKIWKRAQNLEEISQIRRICFQKMTNSSVQVETPKGKMKAGNSWNRRKRQSLISFSGDARVF
jgi:hypothetical protein